ncbi:hypothetical protein CsSME_00041600 [Camellia sinensis var. sinensis]
MKRRREINTRDPPKIRSSSIRVFNGVRSYPETGDDVIRGKRVKFRDPELDCPPNIRHTVSSMQHEAIGDPGSNAPKTSEYAFFKKLKQDAGVVSFSFASQSTSTGLLELDFDCDCDNGLRLRLRSNEWLLGRMDGESDEDNEPVFDDDDDGLTWATVARASGVEERSHASRATSLRSKAQPRISKSSTLTPLQLIDEEEAGSDDTEEEDVEGYKSTDGEEDVAIDVGDND